MTCALDFQESGIVRKPRHGYHMMDSTQAHRDVLLSEQIARQLENDIAEWEPQTAGFRPTIFFLLDLETSTKKAKHYPYSQQQLDAYCSKLYDAISEPEDHCARLDELFAENIGCQYSRVDISRDTVTDACKLLKRLPKSPLELPDLPSRYDSAYTYDPVWRKEICWPDLHVVQHVNINVIRLALIVVIEGAGTQCFPVKEFINRTATLLSTASRIAAKSTSQDARMKWFLVRAFLWTSWQRSSMLYLYCLVDEVIRWGFRGKEGPMDTLQSFYPEACMSIEEMSKRFAGMAKPSYVCGWAFELIRTNRCAIGLDFRNFFQRFSATFPDRPGRCIPGQHASCKGEESDKCQRFRGMEIENQAAHHGRCRGGCKRLIWDRASYVSVAGSRAVTLANEDAQEKLLYCPTSDRTLAISHVWSHGQGGRPELGLNRCLHQRYVTLAKSLDCDSYWMDTPCIPEDHKLRWEAIMKINEIFENSKATLVCDRDLMSIDATELTVDVCERILVTIMVSDWNLRAWTFLEAVRGRHNIYILCKDQTIVSLRETALMVYRLGSIDIALLTLAIPHLLPAEKSKEVLRLRHPHSKKNLGSMTMETGGSHLSHREASRPGDDIVIWSLLSGDNVFYDAEAFWKSRIGGIVYSSFLFSSAPRLKTRGFRWAPSSPTAKLLVNQMNGSKYRLLASNGKDSELATITEDGLFCDWLIYRCTGGLKGSHFNSWKFRIRMALMQPKCQKNLHCIREKFLQHYVWGALLRPSTSGTRNVNPATHRNDSGTTVVAVCATNDRIVSAPNARGLGLGWDDRIRWTWRGIYEWDSTEPLPEFTKVYEILVV